MLQKVATALLLIWSHAIFSSCENTNYNKIALLGLGLGAKLCRLAV